MVRGRYVLFGALQVLTCSVNTMSHRLLVDMVICCMYIVCHWRQFLCSDLVWVSLVEITLHQDNKGKKILQSSSKKSAPLGCRSTQTYSYS